ncbi:hypothetical protein ABT369_06500 [Dactylosporangium sp. NPDC000244]|uniref:hypothetical protein n=1 Tax=Dactylosporangium sp. NPDC000244 TaxID=3154365 RepID=UPI00332E6E95
MPVVRIAVEAGKKKTFAVALDWPGWARAAAGEEAAVAALADYAERFRPVAAAAGLAFPAEADLTYQIVQRWPGSGNTDFGVPAAVGDEDRAAVDAGLAERHVALLTAAWGLLDEQAEASPEELRKGPRGGGRDRDVMVGHVLSSEAVYARKIGIKHPEPQPGETEAIESLRAAVLEVLGKPSGEVASGAKGWPPRYAARRFVWHVLDHLWEMQDRSE